MKLSSNTLSILKNFSEINAGLHFKKGSSLSTWHPQKFVIAEAAIQENLPKNFTIFDLNKLLSISSLFETPEFDFQDDKLTVSANNRSVNYLYAEPSMVLDPGDKAGKYRKEAISGSIATAKISKDDLKGIKQASAILSLPDITIEGGKGKITFTAQDTANAGSDSFQVEVEGDVKEDFSVIMKCSHFKLLDGDYDFICHPKMAYFKHQTTPVEYWVAYQSK